MSWRRARRKVVVVTTFVVHPAAHRGQHRWWALAKQLRRDCDVELLCLGSPTDVASSAAVADGVRQTVAPRTPVHRAIEAQLDLAAGAPIGELLAGVLAEYSPDFEAAAIGSLQDADLAVVAEPSLVEVVHRIRRGLPVVYDAPDRQPVLRSTLVEGEPAATADRLLEFSADVERHATQEAVVRIARSSGGAERLSTGGGVPSTSFVVVPDGVDVAGTPFVAGDDRTRASWRFLGRFGQLVAPYQHIVLVGSSGPVDVDVDAANPVTALATQLPEALFALVGEHHWASRQNAIDNVVAMGRVTAVVEQSLRQSASVGVDVARPGSGGDLGLVEHLAAGLPSISTPSAAGDPSLRNGIHVRVAAAAEDFGAIIDELLSSDTEPNSRAGRQFVEQTYDWSVIGRRLADAVRTAL